MFICEIWLFVWCFPQFCTSDMSKYGYLEVFQGSLRLRDNESRLYWASTIKPKFQKNKIHFKILSTGIDGSEQTVHT